MAATSAAIGKRNALFASSTLLLLLAVGELLAGWVFGRVENRLLFPEPELYVSEPVPLERLAKRFDADLGWVHRYESPFGERPRPRDYGRPLVAAFGDSFTRGDEVKHGQTWGTALAELLGGDVYNFVVGGYGMDQKTSTSSPAWQPKTLRSTPTTCPGYGAPTSRC